MPFLTLTQSFFILTIPTTLNKVSNDNNAIKKINLTQLLFDF